MSSLTNKEKKFIQKVRAFQARTGCTIATIGCSDVVNYRNTAKLEEFILEERGTIQMNVAGRIEDFIKANRNEKFSYGKRE